MVVKEFKLNMIQTNCYVLHKEGGSEAVIIDPGGKRLQPVFEYLDNNNLRPAAVLLTHGHFDHIWGVEDFKEKGAVIYVSEGDKDVMADPLLNVSDSFHRVMTAECDKTFKDGEILCFGGLNIKAIYTPGHTKGSTCFYVEEFEKMFTGDTLFQMSVGRTDLPTGDTDALLNSIRNILFKMSDDIVCYPGHGGPTTIGFEKKNNPYV